LQRFKIPEKGIYGTNSKSLAKPGTQDQRLFWKVFSKTARQISNPFFSLQLKKGFLFERAVAGQHASKVGKGL
jgi:hypothetical protein